jgi:hypothetical protein
MPTPQREAKHIQRQLRTIPVYAIAPRLLAEERDGLWCLVAGELEFVPVSGTSETTWDDPLGYAQFRRYVAARPERVYDSWESAQAFVRSHFRCETAPG